MAKKTKTAATGDDTLKSKPEWKTVEVTLHLKVPQEMTEDAIDEKIMEIIDEHDTAHGGSDGFWLDSRCDSVRPI